MRKKMARSRTSPVDYPQKCESFLAEHSTIREEILQKIELHNTLIIYAYTITVALLAIGATINEGGAEIPGIYLLPILAMPSLSIRVAYYRDAVAKLSAYLIVFIEPMLPGMGWEGRNALLSEEMRKEDKYSRSLLLSDLRYFDYPVICLVCLVLYLFSVETYTHIAIGLAVLGFVLTVVEFIISLSMNRITSKRSKWEVRWRKVQKKEAAFGNREHDCEC